MNTRGRHLLVDYSGCDGNTLDDPKHIEELMNEAARAAGARVVASVFQAFDPQGVTGVVVIEESHLSIHTWPEHRYAAVDFFTCGDCIPERAHEVLTAGLRAQRSEILQLERGLEPPGRMIRLRGRRTERRVLSDPRRAASDPTRLVS